MAIRELHDILKRQRFQLHNEKTLQRDIEQVLKDKELAYVRECQLSPKSIIDFLVAGVGVEVKINSSAKTIYKQCERYLQFDQVNSILLVTNKIITLPLKINNKPTMVLNLGAAWL